MMLLDYALGYREPEAGAGPFPGEERLEDQGQILLCNSGAVVADTYHGVFPLDRGRHADAAAAGERLLGVLDDVEHRLLDLLRVEPEGGDIPLGHGELHLLPLAGAAHQEHGVAHQPVQIALPELGPHRRGVIQKGADQPLHPLDFSERLFDHLLVVGTGAGLVVQIVQQKRDAGERVPDLVRNACREFAQGGEPVQPHHLLTQLLLFRFVSKRHGQTLLRVDPDREKTDVEMGHAGAPVEPERLTAVAGMPRQHLGDPVAQYAPPLEDIGVMHLLGDILSQEEPSGAVDRGQ